MNKRQAVLLVVIIAAVLLYCWILFFEVPKKTDSQALAYIETLNTYNEEAAEWIS